MCTMSPLAKKITLELCWIAGAFAAAWVLLLPLRTYEIAYPFQQAQILFIVGGITFIRWCFLWPLTPFAWSIPLKALILLGTVPAFLVGFDLFHSFRVFVHDIGLQELSGHLPFREQQWMSSYLRGLMVFWATGYMIASLLLIPRTFRSIWMQINRNTV